MTEKTLTVGTAGPNLVPELKHPGERTAPQTRRRLFMALGLFAVLAALAYLVTRWLAPPSEETDDAYVGGNIVAVTAREAGTVLALHADNTQRVLRGQPLIELDPAIANVQLDAAEAALGREVRAVRVNAAQVDASGAEIAQAAADLSKAQNDYTRRKAAAAAGAISGEDLSHAADAVTTSRAALDLARARQAQATSTIAGTTIETNPQVLGAIAEVRRAAIDASYMQIVAPLSGVVAQRTVQLGQKVAAGTPLMAVVPLDSVWVDANFRETQLADLRVGQPATITSDVYGGKVVFHGHVAGLGAGSGNAFSLLPPQNATGNWIKIVQRVPVRIALDPAELEKTPLRVGVSVDVEVETADRSGPFVANSAPPAGGEVASLDGGPQLEDRIRKIIAENAGRNP
ncbi:membrane fusion protein (multidrug efflux system) [Paraburkholderia sp. GAS41]|uniref:efflux RND transporter periplasmic adaptor subunit n=1 Tax=Paraburkholderia sp. GAS41 TaxID=3035134 RepID=UPI003D1B7288